MNKKMLLVLVALAAPMVVNAGGTAELNFFEKHRIHQKGLEKVKGDQNTLVKNAEKAVAVALEADKDADVSVLKTAVETAKTNRKVAIAAKHTGYAKINGIFKRFTAASCLNPKDGLGWAYTGKNAWWSYGATIAAAAAVDLVARHGYLHGDWALIQEVALACVGIGSNDKRPMQIIKDNKVLAGEIGAFVVGAVDAVVAGAICKFKKTDTDTSAPVVNSAPVADSAA